MSLRAGSVRELGSLLPGMGQAMSVNLRGPVGGSEAAEERRNGERGSAETAAALQATGMHEQHASAGFELAGEYVSLQR